MNPFSPLTLISQKPSKKPRILVVDDEPDKLNLLYRTFRRNFKVLRALSGIEALDLLEKEGEVAVIISDQRMPEMKGTEFLSKTVTDFPNTVRMILTGFTDVEDLVEAINAGQVYRYITKPWDPDDLQQLVDRASDTYDLINHQHEALHRAETLSKLVVTAGQLAIQSMTQTEALTFLADGFGTILGTDACSLLLLGNGTAGCYGATTGEAVQANELVKTAIATQRTQSALHIQADERQANEPLYAGQTESHLVTPLSYQGETLAVLSLQWNTSFATLDDVTQLLRVIEPQLALSLKATVFQSEASKNFLSVA